MNQITSSINRGYRQFLPFIVILFIGSGCAALIYEVIWLQMLQLVVGLTSLSLGVCQLLLVLTITWASYIITHIIPFRSMDQTISTSIWNVFLNDLAFCTLAVMPPAIFWGASFPLALAAVAKRGQDPGRMVGRVYASNTIGAITGSLAFSLVGIPVLGSTFSQKLIMIISAVAAIMMFSYTFSGHKYSESNFVKKIKSLFNIPVAGATAVTIFLLVILVPNIGTVPWGSVAYGRKMTTHDNLLGITDTPADQLDYTIEPLYVAEGLNGTIAVTQLSTGVRQFHSVGKVQASTEPQDMRLQRMLGHITALITEDPESVMVVGCGAGITAGTFLLHPGVKRIVICDIESLVPGFVAPFFSKENYGIANGIEDGNLNFVNGKEVRFEYDDGRHFIRTSKEKFDIISSDPIDPWAKGAAALYTKEYFELCKSHLKPGGAMSLWVPLYQGSLESVKSMISTFFAVFPDGIIWSNDNFGEGYDVVLFGQNEPTHIDIELLDKKFLSDDYEPVRRSLADVEFYRLEDLLGTYAGRARDLHEWMSGAQLNTDRNLRLSYLSGMSASYSAATEIFFGICKYYKFPEDMFTASDQKLDSLDLNIRYKMW